MVPNHHRNCASEPQEKAEWTAPSSQQWWIKYPRYGWIIGKIWARPTFISHQLWLFIINVHINSTFFLLVLYYNSINFLNIEKKIGKRNWQRYPASCKWMFFKKCKPGYCRYAIRTLRFFSFHHVTNKTIIHKH